MARVYMACGDYAKAEPLAQRALDLSKASDEDERSACLLDLAYLYRNQGRYSEAERFCLNGLALQQKLYYENHPHIGYTLRILSSIYREQGKYPQARRTLEDAVSIMRQSTLPDDQTMASFYADFGRLLTAHLLLTTHLLYT